MYRNVHRGESESRIVILGDGALEDVLIEETGDEFTLGPERQTQADEVCEQIRQRGQTVTADPVYRLLSWTADDRLVLRVERGDYSQVVGMKHHPEWGIKARALAVCCVLECADGFVIEKRSARVAALPGMWHIAPSGSIQPPQSAYATLLTEASEELALEPSEIADVRCVGLLFGEQSGVYQLSCSARTDLTLQQMLDRKRSGAWEQDGFLCAPACPERLPAWLAQHSAIVTRGGRNAMLAEGRRRWGHEWFQAHCEDQPCSKSC